VGGKECGGGVAGLVNVRGRWSAVEHVGRDGEVAGAREAVR
jgi:hypothetical protein